MNPLKRARREAGMELAAIAKAVRYEYPGFDIYLLSKAENDGRYGIRLTARAMALAMAAMGRRKDRRTKPCRIQCRLSNMQFSRLQTARKAFGYATMQDIITDIVDAWMRAHKSEIAHYETANQTSRGNA